MDIEFEKLWRISRELHLSLSLDEALCKILTALTAGEGLAFNRAFLYENNGGVLTLRMKIGAETERRHTGFGRRSQKNHTAWKTC